MQIHESAIPTANLHRDEAVETISNLETELLHGITAPSSNATLTANKLATARLALVEIDATIAKLTAEGEIIIPPPADPNQGGWR